MPPIINSYNITDLINLGFIYFFVYVAERRRNGSGFAYPQPRRGGGFGALFAYPKTCKWRANAKSPRRAERSASGAECHV